MHAVTWSNLLDAIVVHQPHFFDKTCDANASIPENSQSLQESGWNSGYH
jgi:hypothetical protein